MKIDLIDIKYKLFYKLLLFTLLINLTYISNVSYGSTISDKITIAPQSLIEQILLQGRILPLDTIDITAASNARLEKLYVQLGQKVKVGDILLELKSDQLEIDIRNATENLIRAELEFNKKKSWIDSNDVFQAQQTNLKSKLNYQRTKEVYNQNKHLYKQGIISQNELEQSEMTYKDAELNLELSDRNLQQTIARGDQTQVKLLKLALENAKAKLTILEQIKEKLTIKSPIDGVILRANNKEKNSKTNNFLTILATGQNINSGENLLAIGNLNGFAVNVLANEQIIQKITLNQSVKISIPAINSISSQHEFDGTVTAIDAQPNNTDSTNQPPKYNIKIIADYDSSKHNIFLGMTAKIKFDILQKQNTILIPFTSLSYNQDNKPIVKLYHSNSIDDHVVTLGKSNHDNIEVISGLQPGDIIARTA